MEGFKKLFSKKTTVMNPTLKDFCQEQLLRIEQEGLLRHLRLWENGSGIKIRLKGSELINFASNDYLGLSVHPRVLEAFKKSAEQVAGAGASRLITGNHRGYQLIEEEIASFKNAESALVFSSGYAAALGTIPALVGTSDFIVMDKLCHACLVDAARLSGATLRVFPHNNLKRCEELLVNCRMQAKPGSKLLILTESVFSMDGDVAPLDQLIALKNKYGVWIMVDEAHATGVFGKQGQGAAEHFGVASEIEVSMGTLSKALGCVGGFICGPKNFKEFLINSARSFVFSTALPEAVCMAAVSSIRLVREQSQLRETLWNNIKILSQRLNVPISSPILNISIGEERESLKASEALFKKGLFVPAIRYPTVAKGKARLRVSLSTLHTRNHLELLAESLYEGSKYE
jgi:8-amino-7-oxononanoate synthase